MMLQLPQQSCTRFSKTGNVVARTSSKNVKPHSAATTAKKLIADFQAAKREWKKADKELQALYGRYPELEDHLPMVLLYTKTDGEEVFAQTIIDAERAFPPRDDKTKPNYPALREAFAERLGPAREKHREARKCVGIKKAEKRNFDAFFRMKGAFLALCRHKPSSVQDIAMMAGVIRQEMGDVVRCVPEEIGSLYGDSNSLQVHHDWLRCRSAAVDFFAAFLSTLSKAG